MTKPTPPQAAKYKPHPASLPAQVMSFFARNPEETLTLDDISDKFDCTRGNIHTQLRLAVEAGHLKRLQNEDTEWVYKAGHNAPSLPQLHAPTQPAASGKPKSPTGYKSPLLMIDIDALVVEDGMPYIPQARAGESRWAPLFAKLTKKGQSVQVPGHVKGALAAAAATYNKRHPGTTFRVAMVDASTARVWRTA